jgi:ribonuclease P protein component
MAGFAVSRAVGGAVVRNRVKRRLRAIVAERIGGLPPGSKVVVRALPAASQAPFEQLRDDVMSGLDRCLTKAVAQ